MRKVCAGCNVRKMAKFFSRDNSKDDGYSMKCKQCCSAYRKQLRIKHKNAAAKERQEKVVDFFVSFD
jgi:hypothetical protein